MMENGLDIFMPQNNAAASVLTRLIRSFCSPMMESRRDQIRKEILLESKKNKRLALSEIMKTIHDGMAKGSLSSSTPSIRSTTTSCSLPLICSNKKT